MSSDKANSATSWIKSGSYTLAQRLSTAVFGFGSFYFLIRILDKEEFGIWALFLTITTYFEMARSGLVQNAQIKFAASTSGDEYKQVVTSSLMLNAIITLLSCMLLFVVGFFAADWFSVKDLDQMLWQYMLTNLVLLPFTQFTFVQQANLDFRGMFLSYLFRNAAFFTPIMIVFAQGSALSLPMLVLIQTGSAAVGALVAYLISRKYFKLSKVVDWGLVKRQYHFGRYVFGTNLSSMLLTSVDQLMLGYLLGAPAVALYNSAFRVSNLVDVPVSSLAQLAFPHSVKIAASEGQHALKRIYEKSTGGLLALLVPFAILVFSFPEFIIGIIAGEQYLEAAPILRVIILFSLFQPFLRQFGTTLDAIGKPNINFITILLLAAFNVVQNYFFVLRFGIPGAAIATLASYCVSLPITYYILRGEIDISFKSSLANIFTTYTSLFQFFKEKMASAVTK